MTSTPARLSLSTVAVTAIVGESAMRVLRSDMRAMEPLSSESSARGWPTPSARFLSGPDRLGCELLAQPRLHHVGNEAVHATAEREHLLDQPRADVGVLLGGHHEDG